MTKTIFAHASGDTFQMEHILTCVGRDRFAHARKTVSIVSEATRTFERDTLAVHSWIARHANGENPWRAAVEAELEG